MNAGDSTYKSSHVGSSRMFRYLHCGDFRASPQHTLHPAVKGKRIDIIYLDTTYLNPRVSRSEGIWCLLLIERHKIVLVSCPGAGNFGMRRARQTLGFGSRDRAGGRRQGHREQLDHPNSQIRSKKQRQTCQHTHPCRVCLLV